MRSTKMQVGDFFWLRNIEQYSTVYTEPIFLKYWPYSMKCDRGGRVSMTIEFLICVHFLRWNAKVYTIEAHADLNVLNQASNHHDSTCSIMCVACDCHAQRPLVVVLSHRNCCYGGPKTHRKNTHSNHIYNGPKGT